MHIWLKTIVFTIGMLLVLIVENAQAQESSLIPITADNAAQLVPLAGLNMNAFPIELHTTGATVAVSSASYSNSSAYLWPLQSLMPLLLPGTAVRAISASGRYLIAERNQQMLLIDSTVGSNAAQVLTATPVAHAVFSPDETLVLTIGRDRTNTLWDVTTGDRLELLLPGRAVPVFSLDSRELVLLQSDDTVVWDVATKTTRLTLPFTADGAIFRANGTQLITYSATEIALWDFTTGVLISRAEYGFDPSLLHVAVTLGADENQLLLRAYGLYDWQGQQFAVWTLRDDVLESRLTLPFMSSRANADLSPDGSVLAVMDDTGVLTLYAVSSGGVIATLGEPDDSTTTAFIRTASTPQLRFSPSGDVLLAQPHPGQIVVYRWDGGALYPLRDLAGTGITLTTDGSTLLTMLARRVVVAYGVPTADRPVGAVIVPGRVLPTSISVRSLPAADAPITGTVSGDVLVSGRSGDYAAVLNAGGWVRLDPAYLELADGFSPELLPELTAAATIAVLPTPTPRPTFVLEPSPTPLPTMAAVPLSLAHLTAEVTVPPLDGLQPITTAVMEDVRLLGMLALGPTGDAEPVLSLDGSRVIAPPQGDLAASVWSLLDLSRLWMMDPYPEFMRGFAASANGNQMAYWTYDEEVTRVVSWEDDTAITTLPIQPRTLLFTPDGERLLAVTSGTTRLYDAVTGAELLTLPVAGTLDISPDGELALINTTWEVRGFSLNDGAPLFTIPAASMFRYTVFSPDSRQLALVSQQGLSVWERTGTRLWQVAGRFSDALFHPSGRLLATQQVTDNNIIVQLWDTTTGAMVATYSAGRGAGMAFSPDGSLLVLGSPLRLIDLASGASTQPAPGYFAAPQPVFSPDGATLLVPQRGNRTAVFGIPTPQRPEWQPIIGRVRSSGLAVRPLPDVAITPSGYVSGEVMITGRALTAEAVYVPAAGGWIWADSDYLELDRELYSLLPVIDTRAQHE